MLTCEVSDGSLKL
jgi:hypothetical protein